MTSIKQALATACDLAAVSDTARLDTEILLACVTESDKTYLYTWPDQQLTEQQRADFSELMRRRAEGVPVAYLTGSKEFWSLPLRVSEETLIPRPETELLVELTLQLFQRDEKPSIADLGAGTGAIALAIASERPGWKLTGCDRTKAVVALAEHNRRLLALNNVRFLVSNWCADLPETDYDLILSNPPYIEPDDPHLDQGDIRFEPKSALVASEEGLGDIKRIAAQAKDYLKVGGYLMLEHGWNQAGPVAAILEREGYTEIQTHQDLAGCDRATLCRLTGD